MSRVGAVVIGRNEGDRLIRCLTSLAGLVEIVVYVDSGSTDDSVGAARTAGARIVELDPSLPFTAARARQAGFDALKLDGDLSEFVQFVDGDCGVDRDWIPAGQDALVADPTLGLVTGWRSEIEPDRSIYNALCQFEWRRPAGQILTCGGDMMVRRSAFEEAGGFNATVIAAEDDEFCIRLRGAGWRLLRLPIEMTCHDADMTRFGQWWRRAVRSGHGFAQVGDMHPEYFVRDRRRVLLFGALLPILGLAGLVCCHWLAVVVILLYAASYLRTLRGLEREGLPRMEAAHHALFLSLSKFPNVLGMITYAWRKLRNAKMRIIEYK